MNTIQKLINDASTNENPEDFDTLLNQLKGTTLYFNFENAEEQSIAVFTIDEKIKGIALYTDAKDSRLEGAYGGFTFEEALNFLLSAENIDCLMLYSESENWVGIGKQTAAELLGLASAPANQPSPVQDIDTLIHAIHAAPSDEAYSNLFTYLYDKRVYLAVSPSNQDNVILANLDGGLKVLSLHLVLPEADEQKSFDCIGWVEALKILNHVEQADGLILFASDNSYVGLEKSKVQELLQVYTRLKAENVNQNTQDNADYLRRLSVIRNF